MFILNENNGVYIRIPEAIKLDDFDDFFKSTHNQYLTKEV